MTACDDDNGRVTEVTVAEMLRQFGHQGRLQTGGGEKDHIGITVREHLAQYCGLRPWGVVKQSQSIALNEQR